MAIQQTIDIVNRFYSAIDHLTNDGALHGTATFTKRYGIDRRNFLLQKKQPERMQFQAGWLEILVDDFGVSPDWLLTGNGDFYRKIGKLPANINKASSQG
jgi:hypothetical protein